MRSAVLQDRDVVQGHLLPPRRRPRQVEAEEPEGVAERPQIALLIQRVQVQRLRAVPSGRAAGRLGPAAGRCEGASCEYLGIQSTLNRISRGT